MVAASLLMREHQLLASATAQVDLLPNGRNIPVTNDNALLYIHRVADYRLNYQIRAQSEAFLRVSAVSAPVVLQLRLWVFNVWTVRMRTPLLSSV